MKFLELPELDPLNAEFSSLECSDVVIHGRLEAYSCKAAGADKKLQKTLEEQLERVSIQWTSNEMEAWRSGEYFSPSDATGSYGSYSASPFGPLTEAASRKTLIYLILTLNAAYPDYDFSYLRPEHFVKERSYDMVVNSVNLSLAEACTPSFLSRMWQAIDSIVDKSSCDIYCYLPDLENDPFIGEGKIWSFNYFFYNKKHRRLLFLTCNAESKIFSSSSDHEHLDVFNPESSDYDVDEYEPNLKNYEVHYFASDSYISTHDDDDMEF